MTFSGIMFPRPHQNTFLVLLCVALMSVSGRGELFSGPRREYLIVTSGASAIGYIPGTVPAPTDSIRLLRDRANSLIHDNKLDDALRIYKRITLAVPHDLGAAITLADLYAWTGDYDRAVARYRDVLDHDSLNLAGLKGLARVMRWSTRYSEAEQCYAAVLRVEPDDIDALVGMALTYAQQRNFEVALQVINRAFERSPRNAALFKTRGDILAWGNQFKAAEENYLAALRLDPRSEDVYRSLGDLYHWAGKSSDAINALKKAHELNQKDADVLVTMANVYLDAGMLKQSEETLKALFGLDPNSMRGFDILRRLDARNSIDYAAIINGYAKPAFLLTSNIIVGLYFWRKRERFRMRSHPLMMCVYRLWPVLAALWIMLFLLARTTGFPQGEMMTGIAEFGTMVVWMIAFITLVWVTRTQQREAGKAILAIGAHPDDIELGCGGTLSRYKEHGYKVFGLVITSGEAGNPYTNECIDRCKEAEHGASILGLDGIWVYHFKDRSLYAQINDIREVIEGKIRETGADIIITQSPYDTHQDHKAVFEATNIAARGNKTLMCYEDVSTGPHFAANYFVDITDFMEDKISAIQAHRTQKEKPYMDAERISGRAAHRGLQTGVRYAEAFLLYRGHDLWPSS